MTEVAKQAVLNLKKREEGVKFKEPLAKPEKQKEPPPKRHQHPLPTKGKSAYVGKGKATAPGKKPLEGITISAREVLESLRWVPETTVTSPFRPTATSVLKLIETKAETVTKPEVPIEEIQNKDNEARELPPTTDVKADLELSQDTEEEDIHGVHIVDLDAELDADKPFICSLSSQMMNPTTQLKNWQLVLNNQQHQLQPQHYRKYYSTSKKR